MNDQLQNKLAVLAEKLGTTAENILGLYRKQMPLFAIDDFVGLLFGIAVAYGCWRLLKKATGDEEFVQEWSPLVAYAPSVGIVLGISMAWFCGYWLLTLAINPDFYIWNVILRELKSH